MTRLWPIICLLWVYGASAFVLIPLHFTNQLQEAAKIILPSINEVIHKEEVKVPVTLGVMSRCPDALLCETIFDRVLAQVSSRVNLSLSFIGTINDSEPDFGVTCMHGVEECAGNVQELCAAAHLPQDKWWQFLQCQNYLGRDKIGLPDTAIKCANASAFEWEGSDVGKCAGEDGSGKAEEGVKLLKASVQASKDIGIESSCTILINGKKNCVHDGRWKECPNGHTPQDFIRQINSEYDRLNGDTPDDSS